MVLVLFCILLTTGTGCEPCINGYKQLISDKGIAGFSFENPCKWMSTSRVILKDTGRGCGGEPEPTITKDLYFDNGGLIWYIGISSNQEVVEAQKYISNICWRPSRSLNSDS